MVLKKQILVLEEPEEILIEDLTPDVSHVA
jgi:hypothetical protein